MGYFLQKREWIYSLSHWPSPCRACNFFLQVTVLYNLCFLFILSLQRMSNIFLEETCWCHLKLRKTKPKLSPLDDIIVIITAWILLSTSLCYGCHNSKSERSLKTCDVMTLYRSELIKVWLFNYSILAFSLSDKYAKS